MESKEFIRGMLRTIILRLLAQEKKMYGYEITQRVEVLSHGDIKLTFGALYPILYKLESEGLLNTSTEIVDGRARKYYSLTSEGKKVAKVKVSELQRFTQILRDIVGDGSKPDSIVKLWSN